MQEKTRRATLSEVRQLIRGVGRARRVSRMRLSQLRGAAHDTLTGANKALLTQREYRLLTRFLEEDPDWGQYVCHGCDRVTVARTCNNAFCESCCSEHCEPYE